MRAGTWRENGHMVVGRMHMLIFWLIFIQRVVFPLSLNEWFPYFEVTLVARRLEYAINPWPYHLDLDFLTNFG